MSPLALELHTLIAGYIISIVKYKCYVSPAHSLSSYPEREFPSQTSEVEVYKPASSSLLLPLHTFPLLSWGTKMGRRKAHVRPCCFKKCRRNGPCAFSPPKTETSTPMLVHLRHYIYKTAIATGMCVLAASELLRESMCLPEFSKSLSTTNLYTYGIVIFNQSATQLVEYNTSSLWVDIVIPITTVQFYKQTLLGYKN
jgi:hypothetical protein